MVVANAAHRERTEALSKLPARTLDPKVGTHAVKMVRDLRAGTVRFFWAMATNPFQDYANAHEWIRAAREGDNVIVVSDCHPTVSAEVADRLVPGLPPPRHRQRRGRGAHVGFALPEADHGRGCEE